MRYLHTTACVIILANTYTLCTINIHARVHIILLIYVSLKLNSKEQTTNTTLAFIIIMCYNSEKYQLFTPVYYIMQFHHYFYHRHMKSIKS